uniref:DNA helicase n=1 Tax=Panagrellus redivivus TaxID=6233 RepID=A0A7E5A0B6_PANRE
MSSKDLIVLMTDQDLGYVIRRRTKEKIKKPTYKELAEALYAAAPQEKVCAVYACCAPYLHRIQYVVEALESAGYTNIKTVNQAALRFGHLTEASHLQLRVNDCVAFDTTNDYKYSVYQRKPFGYVFLGDHTTIQSGVVMKSKEVKIIIVTNRRQLSDAQCKDYNFSSRKPVWFSEDDEYFAVGDIWRFQESRDYKVPVPFVAKIRFTFGNMTHFVEVKYDQLPFQTEFDLDIEDSREVDVDVAFNNNIPYIDAESFTFENDGTKNQKIHVTINVPETFIPVVKATVISETDKPDYCVYSIDYNAETKQFSAWHITVNSIDEVVSECSDIKTVLELLNAYRPYTTLHGVLINYSEAKSFPFDVHRSVIDALVVGRLTLPRLLIGPTQTDFSIHLWNAKVNVKLNNTVAIFDSASLKSYFFKKTKNGFDPRNAPSKCDQIVFITNTPREGDEDDKTLKVQRINSAISTFPKDIKHKFAWDFFNGKDFDGYMIRPYCGVGFDVRTNDLLSSLYTWDNLHNEPIQRHLMLDVDEDLESICPIYQNQGYLKSGHFTENPSIYLHYIGFPKPILLGSLQKSKTSMALLNLFIDAYLLPSHEFRETKQLCDLLDPPKALLITLPKEISALKPIGIVILDGGNLQFIATHSNGILNILTVENFARAAEAISDLQEVAELERILDVTDEPDRTERQSRMEILENKFDCTLFHLPCRQFQNSFTLAHRKVELPIGQTVVIFNINYGHLFLEQCERGFKAVYFTYDNVIRPLFSKHNVKLVIFDNQSPATVKIYTKKFTPFKCINHTTPFDKVVALSQKFINSYFGDYAIAVYDIVEYTISINDGEKQVIYDGVVNLPFEKIFLVKMDDTTNVTIDVACQGYEKQILNCDTTDWKSKYYYFKIRQVNQCSMEVEHFEFKAHPAMKIPCFSKDGLTKIELENPSPTILGLTFKKDNTIAVTGLLPDYDIITINPVPAYFRLVKTEDGVKTQVGVEAQAARETDPTTVIYDFPNLLAANTDQKKEDPTWSFRTSRADDGSLLIDLGNDNITSPLPLFASIVKSAYLYAKPQFKQEIEEILVFVSPLEVLVSDEELTKVSNAIGMKVKMHAGFD